MLAGGVAVEAFMTGFFGPELRRTVSVFLLALAILIGGGSFFRWLNVERAMRRKTPLPLTASPRRPGHTDPGLQPERTDLAWGRTTLSLVIAAAVFLRWLPHHGWFVITLISVSITTAWAIDFTRKHRFQRAVQGINQGQMPSDAGSTAAVAASVVILALLGIYTVMFLPMEH